MRILNCLRITALACTEQRRVGNKMFLVIFSFFFLLSASHFRTSGAGPSSPTDWRQESVFSALPGLEQKARRMGRRGPVSFLTCTLTRESLSCHATVSRLLPLFVYSCSVMAATPENIELSKKMLKEVAEATTKKRRPKEGADKGGVAAGAGGAGAAASSSAVASATVSGHKRKLVAVKETVRTGNLLIYTFIWRFFPPASLLAWQRQRHTLSFSTHFSSPLHGNRRTKLR